MKRRPDPAPGVPAETGRWRISKLTMESPLPWVVIAPQGCCAWRCASQVEALWLACSFEDGTADGLDPHTGH